MSRETVRLSRDALGEGHSTTQRARSHLGTALVDGDKLEEAAEVYSEATEIAVRERGPNYVGTARLRKKWDQATVGGPLSVRLYERKVCLGEETVFSASGNNDVVPGVLYDHGVIGLVFKREE